MFLKKILTVCEFDRGASADVSVQILIQSLSTKKGPGRNPDPIY